MKIKKRIYLQFLLPLFWAVNTIAQPCANAGRDTLVCGFTYNLIGQPNNGSWSFICNDTSKRVKIDSLFPSTSKVSVNSCGSYKFVYTVGDPCPSSDTVVITFENRSFKIEDLTTTLSLRYNSIASHISPQDSCGNKRILESKSEPIPLWHFNFVGRCENFGIKIQEFDTDTTSCLLDSITYDILVKRDTTKFNWFTSQSNFLIKESSNQIVDNRFFDYINLLQNGFLGVMDSLCPLNKCYTNTITCLDTTVYDTLNLRIPVHCGGQWHLVQNSDTLALNDSNIFTLNGQKYEFDILTGSKYYGPNSLQFELFEIDSFGVLNNIYKNVSLPIIWRETWIYDTLTTIQAREITDDKCSCNGRSIYIDTFVIPDIPLLNFQVINLKFSKNINPKISGKSFFCKGQSLALSTDKVYKNYLWSTSDTTRSIEILTEGKYYLNVEDSLGCIGVDSIIVSEIDNPNFSIDASATVICRGNCATLEIKADSTITGIWNNTDTSTIFIACPTIDQTYFAQAINQFGCSSVEQIKITVRPTPDPNAGENKEITCSNSATRLNPVRLDLGNGRYFFWTGPGINSFNRDSTSPLVNQAGIYVLHTIDSTTGCSGTDTVEVKENKLLPKSNAGNDQTLNCKFTTLNLLADTTTLSIGYSFKWQGPDIYPFNQNQVNPKIGLPGSYILEVMNLSNGCVAYDTILIRIDTLKPKADAGIDKLIYCDSIGRTIGSLLSSSGSNFAYEWKGPNIDTANNKSKFLFAKTSGTYTLLVKNQLNYCVDSDQVIVTLPLQYPIANATKLGDLGCRVDSIQISGKTSIGSNLKPFWIHPNLSLQQRNKSSLFVKTAGTYILEITDTTTHCKSYDTIVVNYTGPIPNASAGPDQKITCDNEQVVLEGSILHPDSITSFIWQGPGITFSNIKLKKPVVDKEGIYLLYVTDTSNNCEFVDTVRVTKELLKSTVDLGPDRILNCKIDSFEIIAQITNLKPNYYFQWNGPGIIPGTERMVRQKLKTPGTYSFFVSTPNKECFVADTIVINKDTSLIDLNLIDTFVLNCVDTNLRIDVSTISKIDSVQWYLGNNRISASNSGEKITLRTPGTYYYYSYQDNGCFNVDSLTILPYKELKFVIETTKTCDLSSTGTLRIRVIDGVGPFKFSIGNTAPDTISYFTQLSGDIIVRVVDGRNCVSSRTIRIDRHPPFPTMIRKDTTIQFCDETTLLASQAVLDNKSTPLTYLWSRNGEKTSLIIVNQPDTYTVTITDENKCGTAISTFYVESKDKNFDDVFKMPNVFTPNEDNLNDTYNAYIEDEIEVTNFLLKIYNRWGQLVFESDDPTLGWNGEYKNEKQPTETYLYIVTGEIKICSDIPESFKIKGDLSLLR